MFFMLVHFFRAMSSPTNKEQFLKQFDSIVRGIVDNKERVGLKAFNLFSRYWFHVFPFFTRYVFPRLLRAVSPVSTASFDWLILPFITLLICSLLPDVSCLQLNRILTGRTAVLLQRTAFERETS